MPKNTIMMVTGGTGGHIFPCVAIADELKAMSKSIKLVVDPRSQTWQHSFTHHQFKVLPLMAPSAGKLLYYGGLLLSLLQAALMLRNNKPALVIGFGGYMTLPILIMAKCYNIPIVLFESNSVLGKVNAKYAPIAKAIFSTSNLTDKLGKKLQQQYEYKFHITGPVVRSSVAKEVTYFKLPAKDEKLQILVTGGSQGASIFANILPKALAKLDSEYLSKIKIIQQVRTEQQRQIKQQYQKLGVEHNISSFFKNIGQIMAKSHLMISRSG
ncbi:MAG: UDP-N-acetylglucosamine--N-acetylmuramyl-(pentapeptide) pyrophosphoryl-undecaprenol N-acetylglucosamine transferase, partial [Pseudomonadota bacterium]